MKSNDGVQVDVGFIIPDSTALVKHTAEIRQTIARCLFNDSRKIRVRAKAARLFPNQYTHVHFGRFANTTLAKRWFRCGRVYRTI